ncbi:MAG: NUDIX domain-containing protein [Rhodobacter sp.]|nr:NUDIX domain-containing protein [Paracoccaceae bacterium]MCC0075334.1 NUDIX domain-containing protein [Rhodobacter sp.]
MSGEALFLYGTLRHAPLLATVAGEPLAGQAAWLDDHAVTHAVSRAGVEQDFPLFAAQPGAVAEGLVIRPGAGARARLDAYERVFGYEPVTVTVHTDQGPVEAAIYLPDAGMWRPGRPWSLEHWAGHCAALTIDTAAEVLALIPVATPEAILMRYGMLESLVASRHRAAANPAPATLRRVARDDDVALDAHRRPYTWFFGVEEADLRFRRFDGSFSPSVTRAGFVMADAVTVLPYDPVRDVVMLVEQFRFGPWIRGDVNPWSLEPIAGRIDGAETPEDAVRREAREEARLELRELRLISRYYISPGAVTEYFYSYVALTDLPSSAEGVSGLEIEAEDIRAHVIPFERLMQLLTSGEIENGPLVISAQWLALNREALRHG